MGLGALVRIRRERGENGETMTTKIACREQEASPGPPALWVRRAHRAFFERPARV
ncbi:Hypothetical protein A7982_10228 [Minicystis rosea]|nr:Hypothetical protein A7982_10228 [Minicystis rosea]